MSKNSQIKREDIISNEALNWADDYAKTVEKAIETNEKFKKSITEIQELQKQTKPTFAEKEADIFRKRLNLLALIMDIILDTDQKTKIFKLLQSIEKIDSSKYEEIWIKNTYAYLSTLPTVLTYKEIQAMIDKE